MTVDGMASEQPATQRAMASAAHAGRGNLHAHESTGADDYRLCSPTCSIHAAALQTAIMNTAVQSDELQAQNDAEQCNAVQCNADDAPLCTHEPDTDTSSLQANESHITIASMAVGATWLATSHAREIHDMSAVRAPQVPSSLMQRRLTPSRSAPPGARSYMAHASSCKTAAPSRDRSCPPRLWSHAAMRDGAGSQTADKLINTTATAPHSNYYHCS